MKNNEDSVTTSSFSDTAKVIFKGPVNLWRIRTNIDVCLVLHGSFDVVEVIGYNPDLNKESRLYVRGQPILDTIKTEVFEKELHAQKDDSFRFHKQFNAEAWQKDYFNNFLVQFINKRISGENTDIPSNFHISLNPLFGDATKSSSGGKVLEAVLDSPPTHLTPYVTRHIPKVSSNVIMSALDSLTKEQKNLASFTKVVDTIVTSGSSDSTKRSRNSILLKSIDDNFIMECTNFFTASSAPEIFGILKKHANHSSSPAKLDPVQPVHPVKNDENPSVSSTTNGSKESGKTHGQHIHGMKLLKKVGSFKFSDDPEALYGNAMLSPHLEDNKLKSMSVKSAEANVITAVEGGSGNGKLTAGPVRSRYLMETKASKKRITANLKQFDRKKSWSHFVKKPVTDVLLGAASSAPVKDVLENNVDNEGKGAPEGDKEGVSKRKKGGKKKEKAEIATTSTEYNKRSDEEEGEPADPDKRKVMTRMRYRKQKSEESNENNVVLEKEVSSMHKRFDNIRSISEKYDADLVNSIVQLPPEEPA